MAKLLPQAAACALLALASVVAPAADVYVEPDAPVVALVLGDTIRLRSPDDVRQAIVVRLVNRYAAEKGIVAQPAEVAAQADALRGTLRGDRLRWSARLEEIERRLLVRTLGAAERQSLVAEREVLLVLLRAGTPGAPSDPPLEDPRIVDPLAAGIVRQWKVDRALHAQYGGRIALQPGGPEPIDAYRRFLEERRDRGEFQFLSADHERAFWRYYQGHAAWDYLVPGSAAEARAFATPPWQASAAAR